MIVNVFTIFDPSSYYFSISWIVIIIPIILIILKKTNKQKKIILIIITSFRKEFKQLIKKNHIKYSLNLIRNIFLIILLINIRALIPYNFTPTAHLSVNIVISLTIWVSIMLWGWLKSFKDIIIHLTPTSTPISLINFIVLIESTRNIIRPITLSVRLTANMVAGHLLISLLSRFSIISNINILTRIVFIYILSILEIIVAIVQAYVITVLLILYQNERI